MFVIIFTVLEWFNLEDLEKGKGADRGEHCGMACEAPFYSPFSATVVRSSLKLQVTEVSCNQSS